MAGRPPIELNEDEIQRLAAMGCRRSTIAKVMGVDERTIGVKYKEAFRRGQGLFEVKVNEKFDAEIADGNTALIIFALKNYHGMADKPIDQDPKVGTKHSKANRVQDIIKELKIDIPKPK